MCNQATDQTKVELGKKHETNKQMYNQASDQTKVGWSKWHETNNGQEEERGEMKSRVSFFLDLF